MESALKQINPVHELSIDELNDVFGKPKRDSYPLINEGIYEVQYLGHSSPLAVFGPNEKRVYVNWKIISSGQFMGTELFQSFKFYERYGRRSKFYRSHTIATGASPSSRTRMRYSIFVNKVFEAAVVTVKPKYESGYLKGKAMPEAMHYSIVEELVKKIFG